MKIVEFYRNERGNINGHRLDDVMGFSLGAMEVDHDWVQWLLPSNETSSMNGDAPTLTLEEATILSEDPELREKVKASFLKFIDFLGLQMIDDGATQIITALPPTHDRPNPLEWMEGFNHNMLRVTRCLKCMRLTGHENYAAALFRFLRTNQNMFSINTFAHWRTAAMKEDLWAF